VQVEVGRKIQKEFQRLIQLLSSNDCGEFKYATLSNRSEATITTTTTTTTITTKFYLYISAYTMTEHQTSVARRAETEKYAMKENYSHYLP